VGANSNGTSRVFANVGAEKQTDAAMNDQADECWSRIDGLWVERGGQPTFDTGFVTDGWGEGADTPELLALTHSVYTSPDYLIIAPSTTPGRALRIYRPFLRTPPADYQSSDPRELIEALVPGAAPKTYRSGGAPEGLGDDLRVRAASNGTVVIETGGRQFVRPSPALTAAQRAAQPPMEDAFNRDATIQFVDVVTKGIDATTQNPNRLADSNKARVFATPGSTDYYTKDRKIVPIDMALDLRSDQGSVFYSSLMSSASEIQRAYSSSYGYSVQVGLGGSSESRNSSSRRSGGRKSSSGKKRTMNLEASAGFGANFAQSQFSQLRRSSSVSQAIGYSRQKQFALIRDYAQSELDGFFRDAVISAVQSGNFDRLIATFGTHYPHATTFGSSGQVRHTTTRKGFERVVGSSSESNYQGGGKLLIVEANYNKSESRQSSSSYQSSTEYGTAFFDAVGGNGSWNESGFSAGQSAYPILMDMRPLDDLLNPIHFPGQPDVYTRGRASLADAIDEYMAEAGRRMDRGSLRPEIVPRQRWTIRALSLNCHRAGSLEGNRGVIQLKGQMRLDVKYPTTRSRIVFNVDSKKGYRRIFCDGRNHTATDATKYVLEGTAQELSQAKYAIRTNFDEVDFGSPIKALRTYEQGGLAQALWPDKIFQGTSGWFYLPKESELDSNRRLVREYGVPGGAAGKQPDLRLRVEFARVE
jgi:hypothetical protein